MFSCADFLAEFGDYLDDVADPELRTRLEEHLRECKTCQVIVDSTRKTVTGGSLLIPTVCCVSSGCCSPLSVLVVRLPSALAGIGVGKGSAWLDAPLFLTCAVV